MNLSIIGAGSSYTPELIERLAAYKERLPVQQIVLMDIDEIRLNIMTEFCKRYAEKLGYDVSIKSTTDRGDAIKEADFIITEIRVGGNSARINDEKIPMKYGLIGQETTGAGGFTNALRTIPVMLDIAHDVERYNSKAWIINYTNPTGIVAEAVSKYSKAKVVGLCAGGFFPQSWVAQALNVEKSSVRYDFFGLNHMNFAYNITINGRPLTQEEFSRVAKVHGAVDAELIEKLHLLPSPYLQYYFHTQRIFDKIEHAKYTRAEEVKILEEEVFAAYADVTQNDKPKALSKRGGGGYSEVAIGIIDAIYNDEDRWMVTNIPNNGAIKSLPDDAVVEIGSLVNASGIHPLVLTNIPSGVWGLVSAVKNYEQLTVEAAVSGDRDTALMALLAHPLIRDYDTARPLLEELLEANKMYLPQFFV